MAQKSNIPVIDETNPKEWTISISSWKTKKVGEWQQAARDGDILGMTSLLAELNLTAPDGSLADEEYLGDLEFGDWVKISKEVANAISAMFRS